MFDNVGRNNDEEAVTRSLLAFGSVAFVFGFVWVTILCYGLIRVTEQVTGLELLDENLVDLTLEDEEPELEAPPPPPPPPPPPAAADSSPDDEDEEVEKPEPDQMVEDVAELKEEIKDKQVSAAREAGVEGGVEGGVVGGVVGGTLGGVVGGVIGGQLGGSVRTVHHSEVKPKRRIPPAYPETARAMNLGDQTCRVRVFIDEAGAPYDVVIEACPKVFHAETTEALMKWRWYPARDDQNRTVKAQFLMNVVFKLK